MDALKLKMFEYGFALIAGPLAAFAVQMLKRYSVWIDSRSAWEKRAFVFATVSVFTALGALTGADFGVVAGQDNLDFLATIDKDAIKVLLGSGVAFLLHALKPKKK